MNKTKIIVTIGPATESKEQIKNLIYNGMDIVRINTSHASIDFCKKIVTLVNELNDELNTNIPIMFDLEGPDIRIGSFTGNHAYLKKGTKIRVYMDEILGDSTKFSVNYKNLIDDVKYNTILKLGDGNIDIEVIEKGTNYLLCEVLNDGIIENGKSINIPGSKINLPFLSEKDREYILLGHELNIDFLALSFVSNAEEVLQINDLLIELGNDHIGIVSKIENENGITEIDNIIRVSDGIMIARGDLGVEIPIERVPGIQKMIISKCHTAGKISIVATEMLSSMENIIRPTRAEVSDVANAVLDSVDAVMLSGETTIGKYPIETVKMMEKIIESAEYDINYLELLDKAMKTEKQDVTGIISYTVTESADRLKAIAIVAPTMSGYTARKMSRFRPSCPIIAVSPNIETVKSLGLHFGVHAVLIDELNTIDKIMVKAKEIVKEKLDVKDGDKIIITGGYPFKDVRHTNFMKIEEL